MDMNLEVFESGWIPMGWMQFAALFIHLNVAFMCLMAIYVIVHQTFYAYRLMTAGPHGFEQVLSMAQAQLYAGSMVLVLVSPQDRTLSTAISSRRT